MGYKVIITGSTGMVGKGVLLECLDHPEIAKIVLINRRPVEIDHPKINEIIHDDYYNFSGLSEELDSLDACFFCLGISSLGKSEQEYKRITYDITLSLARTLSNINPETIFCYVSGAGTNANGRLMWSRIKGRTEQDLVTRKGVELSLALFVAFRPLRDAPFPGRDRSFRLFSTASWAFPHSVFHRQFF